MIIRTHPHRDTWIVVASWFGADRIVFEGDVFAACRFARAHT